MKPLPLAALALSALLAFAVHAQAPQQPAETKAEPSVVPPPGPGQEPDPAIIQDIMECLAVGLPTDWQKAWLVIREAERDKTGKTRTYVAITYFATDAKDSKGQRLQNCGANRILVNVGKLNDYLPGDQQRWTAATFNFYRDGRFDAAYDYTPPKPAAKSKAKPAAKKKPEATK